MSFWAFAKSLFALILAKDNIDTFWPLSVWTVFWVAEVVLVSVVDSLKVFSLISIGWDTGIAFSIIGASCLASFMETSAIE